MSNRIYIVGIGPGREEMMTGEAIAALEQADILGGLPLEGGILWCATEKVPREALDRTIAIVKEVLSK